MKLGKIMKSRLVFSAFAVLLSAALLVCGWFYARANVADEYYISSSSSFRLASLPVTVGVDKEAVTASAGTEEYSATAKLFGFIPLKSVRLTFVTEKRVIVGGEAFGLKMYTNGLMVVGFSDISTAAGPANPAQEAGIEKGDILKTVDGEELNRNSDFAELINSKNGAAAEIMLERDGKQRTVTLLPVLSSDDGRYKAGMWVRDSAAGIGTISFYDQTTLMFTGLGHGIYDVDTGELLPVKSGEIVRTTITSVMKGQKGAPGELRGIFEQDSVIGELYGNTELGVFGSISEGSISGDSMQIALKQEIETGAAKIIMPAINGGTAEYEIEIVSITNDDRGNGRNMVIEITDPQLLELTGGIVQGMSGSPIIQNGRLIGAVTHVLVNDPTRGYGIFAERMYDLIG